MRPAPRMSLVPLLAGLLAACAHEPAVETTDPLPLPETPPLRGEVSATDLLGLQSLRARSTIRMDLSVLAEMDDATARMLLAHLAADPRWRVTTLDGAVVAVRRQRVPWGWSAGWGGYVGAEGGARRTALRFGAWEATAEWAQAEQVARQPASDGRFVVVPRRVDVPGWRGFHSAALEVEGPAVSLSVHEVAAERTVDRVRSTLFETAMLLEAYVDLAGERGLPDGTVPILLAPGRRPEAQPVRATRLPGGETELTAALNPGRAGWTWVRLTDRAAEPIAPEVVGASTRERIGWSADPGEVFWYQARLPLPVPGDATAEVWFQADGAPEPQLLGSFALDAMISSRSRSPAAGSFARELDPNPRGW